MSSLVIGQVIRVQALNGDGEFFDSRVVEFSSDYLYIEIPLHPLSKEKMRVAVGETINLKYIGKDGAIYRYESPILELTSMPILVWKIASPKVAKVSREQRREYVRVNVDLPVMIEYREEPSSFNKVNVFTRDISGGGMNLAAPRSLTLKPGDSIQIKFNLPGNDFPLDIQGQVLRVTDRNDRGFAAISLNFQGMKEGVRQKIIQYIFTRQRMLK